MESIKILENEHENILQMLEVIQAMAMDILSGNDPNTGDFRLVADFISYYADGHHHDKEEKILFEYMIEYSGPAAQTMIRNGMLVEHDQARYHNLSLREALDKFDQDGKSELIIEILTHVLAYRDLLTRHITKENGVVFPLAERTLPDEIKEKNEEEFEIYQDQKLEDAKNTWTI